MNLARKHVTEISKNNENKSKTRQPHSRAPSSIGETQGKGTTSRRVESFDIWTCREEDDLKKKEKYFMWYKMNDLQRPCT